VIVDFHIDLLRQSKIWTKKTANVGKFKGEIRDRPPYMNLLRESRIWTPKNDQHRKIWRFKILLTRPDGSKYHLGYPFRRLCGAGALGGGQAGRAGPAG